MGLFSKMKTLSSIAGIIGKVKGAFTALFSVIAANPVIVVAAAIIATLVLLYAKCEWFRDGVNAVVQKIVSFFTETLPQAWDSLKNFFSGIPEWWSGIWQQVSDFFMNTWTTMMQNPVISGIVTTITTLWQNAVATWQGIWQGLVTIAQGVWELLKNTILAPVILVIDLVTGNFEKLSTDASSIWENIRNAAKTIWSGIKQVVSSLVKGLVAAVVTLLTGFRDTASKIWDTISQTASKVWTAIKGFVVDNAKKLKRAQCSLSRI